jgi:hypothetical protein
LECQQVKVEHKHPARLLQPLQFQNGSGKLFPWILLQVCPRTVKQHDAIMVVVDKLRKETHFIPIKSTFKAIDVVDVFMKEIFRLHGMPKTIISDRDANSHQISGKACLWAWEHN